MSLEEFMKHVVEDLFEGHDKMKQPIGKISEELRKEYQEWVDEKDELEAEIEFRMERMKKKLEKQLVEEFDPKHKATQERKKLLWDKIRQELNVLGELDLNINTKTGEISQWIDKPNRF